MGEAAPALPTMPTMLRRDSMHQELGLFAFSGSHSSGGFTLGGESSLNLSSSSSLLAGPLPPVAYDARPATAPASMASPRSLGSPGGARSTPGLGALSGVGIGRSGPYERRLPHHSPAPRRKHAQTLFESDDEQHAVLRRAQVASQKREELKRKQVVRQATAQRRRAEIEKAERNKRLAALEERSTRSDRIEQASQMLLRRTLWLALATGGAFATWTGRALTRMRHARAASQWQHAAAGVIQRLYQRMRARQLWRKYAKFAFYIKKHRLRICLHIRCFRRWHAMNVVNNFLLMYSHDNNKLQMIVMRFTTKVYYCQEMARRWLAINRARVAVLAHIFHQVEHEAMQREVKEVNERLAAARAELQVKLQRLDRQGRGLKADDDGADGPPVPLSPRAAREKRRKKRKQKKDASSSHARILAESEQFAHKFRYKDDILQNMLDDHKRKYDSAVDARRTVTVLAALVDSDVERRKRLFTPDGSGRPATAPELGAGRGGGGRRRRGDDSDDDCIL